MDNAVFATVGLLVTAIVIAVVSRLIRLPYTVGLVAAGVAISLLRLRTGFALTHDIIFDVLLPPLLFEAAISLHWKDLRAAAAPVLILAVGGTLISAAVVAIGLVTVLHWALPPAVIFAVLIAATDPVAVIAMFKDGAAPDNAPDKAKHPGKPAPSPRLRLLVEAESLLNDGVAAVLFALALAWAANAASAPLPGDVALTLLHSTGGGIAVGLLCAGVAILAVKNTQDHLVETALTVVVAYGSFLLAERLGASGVLATVAAGLLMGNLGVLRESGANALTRQGRAVVVAFWEFAAFIANSLIFLLIGLSAAAIPFRELGIRAGIVIVALVLAARAACVYSLCAAFARSRHAIPLGHQHILWWGGLRGALSLGLALSLPPAAPGHDAIVIAAFTVVAVSVIAQGLTMPFLLARFGGASIKAPS